MTTLNSISSRALDAPSPGGRLPGTLWRRATLIFAAFLVAVIASANLGRPLPVIEWVRFLPGADFTGHAVLVGTMALLAGGSAPRTIGGFISLGAFIVAVLIVGEELSQLWIPSRSFSIGDLAANALGIGVAEGLRRGAPKLTAALVRADRDR